MTTDDLHEDPITPARFDALVAFLLARLDEDEAAARTALLDREFLPFESVTQTADHGARHGPLRFLREPPQSGRWCRSVSTACRRSGTEPTSGDWTSRRR